MPSPLRFVRMEASWSDYGGESSYQPGYRLENMMWMTLLVYDYIIPGER